MYDRVSTVRRLDHPFQMMPQLSIMPAIQVREPKRLKQAAGQVQVDRVH
jgi:hypothetical protein